MIEIVLYLMALVVSIFGGWFLGACTSTAFYLSKKWQVVVSIISGLLIFISMI